MSFDSTKYTNQKLEEDKTYLSLDKISVMLKAKDERDKVDGEYPPGYPVELTKTNGNFVFSYGKTNSVFAIYPRIRTSDANVLKTQLVRIGNIQNPVRFKLKIIKRKDSKRLEYRCIIFLEKGSKDLEVIQDLDRRFRGRFIAHLRSEQTLIKELEEKWGGESKNKLEVVKKHRSFITKKHTSEAMENEIRDIEGTLLKPLVNKFTTENGKEYIFMDVATDIYNPTDETLTYQKKYTELRQYEDWLEESREIKYSIIPSARWDELLNSYDYAYGWGVPYLNVGRLRRVDKTFTYSLATTLKKMLVVEWIENNSNAGVVTEWKGKYPNKEPGTDANSQPNHQVVDGNGHKDFVVGKKRLRMPDESERSCKRIRLK